MDSNDDELDELARIDSEDEYSLSRRSKKKKAKNTIQNNRMFILKFIIGMLIIEIYFFTNYFMHGDYMNKWEILGKEMNMTGSIEPFFWLSVNV